MNKYMRALIHVPFGILKLGLLKTIRGKAFSGIIRCAISPLTEISLDRGGSLHIGQDFRMRDGAKIRVRKNAECIIGKNVSINSNNLIACHERIRIGDNAQFGANVQIYDHDHDYMAEGGIAAMRYKTSPVSIGNDCWIGANTVILQGTTIGDRCVVGAGCVLKGHYADDIVIVQKRDTTIKYNR